MTNAQLTQAINKLDGQTYEDSDGDLLGVVYFAAETRRYYAVDVDQLIDLAARLRRGDTDAYSRWCAEDGYSGDGHVTEDEAALVAGWTEPVYPLPIRSAQ